MGLDGRIEDDIWRFHNKTNGAARTVKLDWRLVPPREGKLTSETWEELIYAAKLFVASLAQHNARGRPVKASGLERIHGRLLYLLRWMNVSGYSRFVDIDRDAAWTFRDDLAEDKGVYGIEPARTVETLAPYLDILCRLYEQGGWRMLDHPGTAMSEPPYGSLRAHAVAAGIGAKGDGEIPPVPDEVWLPCVEAALEWVDGPASNLARLGVIIARALRRPDGNYEPEGEGLLRALRDADADGSLEEWMVSGASGDLKADFQRRPNAAVWTAYFTMLDDTRDACTILIQAMLGVRISEVASLKGHAVHKPGERPACLAIERSDTGMNEILYVHGQLSKGQDEPTPAQWIAGSRPLGSCTFPAAIRAIAVLEEVFAPWREFGSITDLIVDFKSRVTPPQSASDILPTLSHALNYGQKRFVKWNVRLPDSRRDYNVSTHQWRKSFALFMVRTDERLLAAVSRHFQHISIAVTEQSYIGSDPGRLGLAEDEGVREAVQAVFAALNDGAPIAGRMAETMLDPEHGIAVKLEGCRTDDEKRTRLSALLDESNVRIWTAPWGRCFFKSEKARCHVSATGAPVMTAGRPHYGHRCPSLCAECPNLLVARTHEPFWRERHAENLAALKLYVGGGEPVLARIAAARLKTTFSVLKDLDPTLELPDLGAGQ